MLFLSSAQVSLNKLSRPSSAWDGAVTQSALTSLVALAPSGNAVASRKRSHDVGVQVANVVSKPENDELSLVEASRCAFHDFAAC